jgi:hypothetical protein
MHLCAAYYDRPSESMISHYAEELALLLRDGYVAKYEFGFKKESRRFLSWQYSVLSDGSLSFDDRAGKLLSSIDVSGASFFNYLWHSDKWWVLSQDERDKTEESLPVSRTGGNPPWLGLLDFAGSHLLRRWSGAWTRHFQTVWIDNEPRHL